MGATLDILMVNGLDGDPAVFVQLPQLGSAVLFDAGDLGRLSNRELLKIRTVCISHTHVDHFIGFDRLLRVNVPHFRTIELVGPEGILKNLCGKLASYTWNLLEPDQINFVCHEVLESGVASHRVSNNNGFVPVKLNEGLRAESLEKPGLVHTVPLAASDYKLEATLLDHGIPVCAYALRLPDTCAVSKEALRNLGLAPGPWISELQRLATSGAFDDQAFDTQLAIDSKLHSARTLADAILTHKTGDKLSYVTDILFSKANLKGLLALLAGSHTVVCETNYRNEHKDRAFAKKHLTTKQAALIAAIASAKRLKIFHISNIYAGSLEQSQAESQSYFEAFQQLDQCHLWAEVDAEIEG